MAVTLSTIRTQVRSYLDEATAADWTDAEIDRLINQRYHRLVSFVMTTYEDYYISTSLFNGTASQEEYTTADGLPSDIFKIRRLEFNYDTSNTNGAPTRLFPLNSIDQIDRDLGFQNESLALTSSLQSYYYVFGFGSSIKIGIIPIPDKTQTGAGKIWYIPHIVDLSSDSSTINIPYPERYYHIVAEGATADGLRFGAQEPELADKWDLKFNQSLQLMQEELEDKRSDDYKSVIDVTGELVDYRAI